jgi:hypothetical protein
MAVNDLFLPPYLTLPPQLHLSTNYTTHITVIKAPSPNGSEPRELTVRLHTRKYYVVFRISWLHSSFE